MSDNPVERARQLERRATQLERQWDAQYREMARRPSYKHLSSDDLIRLAQSNKPMSSEEFEALEEAFVETFGVSLVAPNGSRPREHDESDAESNQDELPTDDRALSAKEVCEMINVSLSTLKRLVEDGRFPKPFKASKRRIAWTVQNVRSYREASS